MKQQPTLHQHLAVAVTFAWLLPLVSLIPAQVEKLIETPFLVTLVSLLLIVPLLSYCLLPTTLKVLNRFLSEKTR